MIYYGILTQRFNMKSLFGTSNREAHREAHSKKRSDDIYLVGYDYEVFTQGDAAYLFDRSTGEFSFQHFGNKKAAIQAALKAIKGVRA